MRFFSDAAPYEKRANIRIAIIIAGFAIVAGFVPATAEDRPSDPFGDFTTELNPDAPLVKIWDSLRDKMLIEKGYFHKCLESKDCPSIPALAQTLDEIRQYHGKALLGHLNLSVNRMVKPAPGDWTTPLEAITMRNGDCKSARTSSSSNTPATAGHTQRASSAERIAERMRPIDAKRIEQAEHGRGEITERIGAINALRRSPIAQQVRDDQPEMAGERRNVAAEVGRACAGRHG